MKQTSKRSVWQQLWHDSGAAGFFKRRKPVVYMSFSKRLAFINKASTLRNNMRREAVRAANGG